MDNKEAIIQATISLITEKGDQINEITVREICKRANVGLGLVNYHFGNKDNLIELCVERIVNGIVDNFRSIQEKPEGFTPFAFLFSHYAVSKISMLTDMRTPKENDNTCRYHPPMSWSRCKILAVTGLAWQRPSLETTGLKKCAP